MRSASRFAKLYPPRGGLVAAALLAAVMALPSFAQNAVEQPKSQKPAKVSPYANANKRHVDPATGKHERTTKKAPGHGEGKPTRGGRH